MDLSEIRQRINRVDDQMKEMFLERMSYAALVAEEKGRTGGSVYVPEREQEILQMRQLEIDPEFVPGCRAFFGQLMGISRTYQYAKLAGECAGANEIPEGEMELEILFSCGEGGGFFAAALNAVSLAGLLVRSCSAEQGAQGRLCGTLRLAGDFSKELAKGAVLQILKEADEAVLQPVLKK